MSCCHTLSSSMLFPTTPPFSPPWRPAAAVLDPAFFRLLLSGRVWEPGRFSGDREEGKEWACSTGWRGSVLQKIRQTQFIFSAIYQKVKHTVHEFIDPVLAKTSPKRLFSMSENERFSLIFAKTASINSGKVETPSTQIRG